MSASGTANTQGAIMRAPEYEDAKRIARNGDPQERTALASRAEMAPEILYYLAADKTASVRVAVASNDATPPQANAMLAGDTEEAVRIALARKIAALSPTLDRNEADRLSRLTWETLARLVNDTAVQVRAAIADVVKTMPDAPRSLVTRLAHDTEIPVAGPVLEFSPLLTTDDLLSLVADPPASETVSAIARRPHLNHQVSDAIAASASSSAITQLLSNRSAQIRETTLDALIARAGHHTEWHEPLVQRPALSASAALKLAGIVAQHLVMKLSERPDIDPATAEFLKKQIVKQVSWGQQSATNAHPSDHPVASAALGQAAAMETEGELSEDRLLMSAAMGEARLVSAMLARGAGVALSVVERAASLRSAKGLVALCWKAGFSMRSAVVVQALLGRLPPNAAITSIAGQAWPLSEEEMRWQISFLSRPPSQPKPTEGVASARIASA
jgi:uncharacterized protein (DUF2336 family)